MKTQYFSENVYESLKVSMIDIMNHYLTVTKNAKNLIYSQKTSLDEKNKILSEQLLETVKTFSGVNFNSGVTLKNLVSNPNIRWATMAIINEMVDMVIPNVIITATEPYTKVITGDYGDSVSIKIRPNDLFATSKAGRKQRSTEVQKQWVSNATIVAENHAITIGADLYRILCGLDSLPELIMKVAISLERDMRIEGYNLLNGVFDSLSTSPVEGALKNVGWDAEKAVALAQRVQAFNNSEPPTFVGTKLALAKMTPDFTAFRYTEDSDYFRLGHVRDFKGYDVLELEQVAKWNDKYKLALNDKMIWIVSTSAQKLLTLYYEGTSMNTNVDNQMNADLSNTLTLQKAWGMGAISNSRGGCIVLP